MVNIYKYPLMIGYNCMNLPRGAKILHVADQCGVLTMWVEQPAFVDLEIRNFVVRATGEQFHNRNTTHLGTAISDSFVWHLYEVF